VSTHTTVAYASQTATDPNEQDQSLHTHLSPQELAAKLNVCWEGHDVPWSLVEARFKIKWEDPIGRGSYGYVHEVGYTPFNPV
jgi:hypothetical protein